MFYRNRWLILSVILVLFLLFIQTSLFAQVNVSWNKKEDYYGDPTVFGTEVKQVSIEITVDKSLKKKNARNTNILGFEP